MKLYLIIWFLIKNILTLFSVIIYYINCYANPLFNDDLNLEFRKLNLENISSYYSKKMIDSQVGLALNRYSSIQFSINKRLHSNSLLLQNYKVWEIEIFNSNLRFFFSTSHSLEDKFLPLRQKINKIFF